MQFQGDNGPTTGFSVDLGTQNFGTVGAGALVERAGIACPGLESTDLVLVGFAGDATLPAGVTVQQAKVITVAGPPIASTLTLGVVNTTVGGLAVTGKMTAYVIKASILGS